MDTQTQWFQYNFIAIKLSYIVTNDTFKIYRPNYSETEKIAKNAHYIYINAHYICALDTFLEA